MQVHIPARPAITEKSAWDARLSARAGVQQLAKDPGSVKFRDLVAVPGPDGKSPWVCGWYNAKNSYGGYVGFEPFMAHGTTVITQVRMGEKLFRETWNAVCQSAP